MKVCILTEGGRERGLGHVVRCRAIADALEEVGVHPGFVVEGDDSTRAVLGAARWKRREWVRDPASLVSVVGRDTKILVDSLTIPQKSCRMIEETFTRTAFIDDYRRHHYLHSLVIDWTIGIESDPGYAARKHRPEVEYLLGAKYAALRKEFWDIPEKRIAPRIGNILLTFGGSDIRSLTPPVLRAVTERYPTVRKSVIIGPGYANAAAIEDARDANTRIIHHPTASAFVEALLEADVAICGGGQTLYELARVGVPTVVTQLIDNQRFDIEGWQHAGVIRVASSWNAPSLIAQILDNLKSLDSPEERARVSGVGRSLVDGGGARAIRDRLLAERGGANNDSFR
jgi:spore coat polysaccharide biosynthesis predicted glycosyltransferase SpsG